MIYLIKCEENQTCKIGYTNNPKSRLSTLQTGNPHSLELVCVIDGNPSDESMLHSKFAAHRLKGEWFSYNQEIKDYFDVEDYFMLYVGAIEIIKRLSSAESRIYFYCLRYRNAKFDISKNVRLSMSNEIDLNERTILNTLPSLIDKKLLYQTEDRLYGVNPRYVFYGSTYDRNKSLKSLIELGCKDC